MARIPIQMAKLGSDMEARASGPSTEIVHEAGTEMPVGATIGSIAEGA